MTLSEFNTDRSTRPCIRCGCVGLDTQLNPNNNGLLVICRTAALNGHGARCSI
jgi:hypothetical protein